MAAAKRSERVNCLRKRGSHFPSSARKTQNSLVQIPGKVASHDFLKYGRSFPKSTSPGANETFELASPSASPHPRSLPEHGSTCSSSTHAEHFSTNVGAGRTVCNSSKSPNSKIFQLLGAFIPQAPVNSRPFACVLLPVLSQDRQFQPARPSNSQGPQARMCPHSVEC